MRGKGYYGCGRIALWSGLLLVAVLSRSAAQGPDFPPSAYYIGEGMGETLEDARSAALQALLVRIQAFITTSFSNSISESAGRVEVSAAVNVAVRSALTLKDVGERVSRPDEGGYHVTKYVTRESIREMFRLRRARVIELLEQAGADMDQEGGAGISSAFKGYYHAWLLACIHPDTIRMPSGAGGASTHAGTVKGSIPGLIERIRQSISFTPETRFVDGETTVWQCQVVCAGRPVGRMDFEYFDGVGSTLGEVRRGRTQLNLFFRGDTVRERTASIRIDYRSEEEMDDLLRSADSLEGSRLVLRPIEVTLPALAVPASGSPAGNPKIPHHSTNATIPKVIQEILDVGAGGSRIITLLQSLERQQRMISGSASRFESLEGLYAVVISERGMEAVLRREGGRNIDVRSGREADMAALKGMKMTWVQPLE